MSKRYRIWVGWLMISLTSTLSMAGGDVLFSLARRTVDEDFEPVEDQDALGVSVFLHGEGSPGAFVFGFSRSDAEESGTFFDPFLGPVELDLEATLTEIYVGGAGVWGKNKKFRPFVGGGLTFLDGEFEGSGLGITVSDSDSVVAAYFNGGIFWRLGEAFDLGVDARVVVGGDLELFEVEGSANYTQLGAILGWGW